MKIVVNAIATLGILNEKGIFDLDVQSSKSLAVGNMNIEKDRNNELPGYNDRI